PAATPVTRPLLLFTVAADVLELVRTAVRPVSVLPPASFSVAVSCTVAFAEMLAVAGATVTVATGALDTVTSDVPFTPSLVAVIVAVPAATPVTRPLLLFTVAMDVLELLHTTVRPVSVLPPASFSVAASCTVAFVRMLAVAGATVTVATGALDTVTSDVPFTPSLVAAIVAVPAVTPVTRPLPLFTVAADALELHTTVRPVSVLPPASFSVAVSCTVAFVKMLAVAGATVTVATGALDTVTSDVPFTPSLVAVIVAVPAVTPENGSASRRPGKVALLVELSDP